MEVRLKPAAQKELDKLPDKLTKRILVDIVKLENNPFPVNSKKLTGGQNLYRLRTGDYRTVYFWNKADKKLLITRIRHRKDVYRSQA